MEALQPARDVATFCVSVSTFVLSRRVQLAVGQRAAMQIGLCVRLLILYLPSMLTPSACCVHAASTGGAAEPGVCRWHAPQHVQRTGEQQVLDHRQQQHQYSMPEALVHSGRVQCLRQPQNSLNMHYTQPVH